MIYASTIVLVDLEYNKPIGILKTNDDVDEIKDLIEQARDNWKANDFDMDIDTYFLNCLDNHGYKYEYEDLYRNASILFI